MAAPNLISPTTINGKTTYLTLNSTAETGLLTNASSSGHAYRVTSLYAANIHGSNNGDCTIKYYNAAVAGTGYAIANTISVPADATVIMIGKDAPIWLEENTRLAVTASASGVIGIVLSYEDIS